MIKQVLTPERIASIHKSVQFMAMMAELLRLEYQTEMDVRFKNPMVNQFAGRIIKDCDAIRFHILHNDKVSIKMNDSEFAEEYAGELWRVFHYFIGLPVEQIREVMNQLNSVSEKQAA